MKKNEEERFVLWEFVSNHFRFKTFFSDKILGLHRLFLIGLVVMLCGFFSAGDGFTEQISRTAWQQIQALMNAKALRTPVQRKISSHLIYALKMKRGIVIANGVQTLRTGVVVDRDGKTVVDIKAVVTPALLIEIESKGVEIIHSSKRYNAIRARIPLEQIESVASLSNIKFIQPAVKAITNKINTSEGDIAHNADFGRNTFNVDGSGVKIGVLSDGVNSLAWIQVLGDLPAVTVLSGQDGSGDEGTAMLEIVHDLAPGAELFFATAFISKESFAENILNLRNAGCDVIVDDVSYPDESPFQDDILTQAVNDVAVDGVFYFSSAGNSGNKNDDTSGVWEGNFVPITASSVEGINGSAHDFGWGNNSNEITKDSPFGFALFWSDPLGESGNDYDLFLLDPYLMYVIGVSNNYQNGIQDPFEYINSRNRDDTGNRLVIINYNDLAEPRFLHLNANRGELFFNTDGQIRGHAAAKDAFGVAAVNVATAGGGSFVGGSDNPVETFSSDGPRRVFYEADGTPITPGNFLSTGGTVRQKPDIAAADGVSTATPGFEKFFGTSAAAPHAAAIAALLLDADPILTLAEVRTALTSTALDIEAPGFDRDSGSGIIMADLALEAVIDPTEAGHLQFSAATFTVNENVAHAVITVTRTGGNVGAISVDYATSDGTAIAAIDYIASFGTLHWANGDATPKQFSVTIIDDTLIEEDETLNLILSDPTGGATLSIPNTAILTIIDAGAGLLGDLDNDGDVDSTDLAIFAQNFGHTAD